MKNQKVAAIFRNLAGLLEIKGESIYRIRAYRRAAQVIDDLTEEIEDIAARGDLKKLTGIGRDLSAKIQEIIQTGALPAYEQIKSETPPALLSFLSIPELQPRMVWYLYERLGIRTLEDLEKMVRTHMLRTFPEINKEVEERMIRSIQSLREEASRSELPI